MEKPQAASSLSLLDKGEKRLLQVCGIAGILAGLLLPIRKFFPKKETIGKA